VRNGRPHDGHRNRHISILPDRRPSVGRGVPLSGIRMRATSVKHRFRIFDPPGICGSSMRSMPINESLGAYECLAIVMALAERTDSRQ
jgi:hypothetical protein